MKTIPATAAVTLTMLALLSGCGDSDGTAEASNTAQEYHILARLNELEAESEIRRRLQEYMPLLSAADWDNYIEYFTRDAVLIMTEGTVTGRDPIKARMINASNSMASQRDHAPRPKRADLLSNIIVDVEGDSAVVSSRFSFIEQNKDGTFDLIGSGRYLDRWAIEEGQWRIAQRTVDYDMLRSRPAPQ